MGTIRIYVDESLPQILEKIRCEVAADIKKRYNLNEITVNGTMASKILAAKMRGDNFLSFHIRKVGLNKGVLELL